MVVKIMAEKNKEIKKIMKKIILIEFLVFSSKFSLPLGLIPKINNFKILVLKVTAEVVGIILVEIEEKIFHE